MSKYATISVPVEVKKRLEELKGEKEWGEFLLECALKARDSKVRKLLKNSGSFFRKRIRSHA